MAGKLEAQIIFENTGNYDEEEMPDLLETYEELEKNIGFQDNRSDNRFIVKFHDIFYYMPEELYNGHEEEINCLFEDFCSVQYDWIMDELKEENIEINDMLTSYDIGNYRGFRVNIPEITGKNVAELTMEIYDEIGYKAPEYIRNYVKVVKLLQDLEDNYMEEWINFIDGAVPDEDIKQIRKDYEEYKEKHANK